MTKPIYKVREADDIYSAAIERTDADGKVWIIPIDEVNLDYQRYLRWVENPEAEEEIFPYPDFTKDPKPDPSEGSG